MTACDTCTYVVIKKIEWWCHSIQKLPFFGVQHIMCNASANMGLSSTLPNTSPKPDLASRLIYLKMHLTPRSIFAPALLVPLKHLEVLMGFHQHQMTQVVNFLPTELVPKQRTLKMKTQLHSLDADSEDVYMPTWYEIYLHRPQPLKDLTYQQFNQWWRSATSKEEERLGQVE